MTQTRRTHLKLLSAGAAAMAFNPITANSSTSTVREVQMVNDHPEDDKQLMVFYPGIVRAQPGDIIRFLSVDSNHNTQSFDNMLPPGAEPWKSKLGKDFDLTVPVDGAYGYFCTPHKSWGMVGLLLVGDVSVNYDAIKAERQRGKAKANFAALFEQADAMLTGEA
ncbi:MAG: plastocyanin/azurin family copper-binding protein [Pseudomonadota bacterium]